MSRTDPQLNLRIPQSLKDSLAKSAQHNKRSLTAEVLSRLESSFDEDARIDMMTSYVHEDVEETMGLQLLRIRTFVRNADEMIKSALKLHCEATGETFLSVDENGITNYPED